MEKVLYPRGQVLLRLSKFIILGVHVLITDAMSFLKHTCYPGVQET